MKLFLWLPAIIASTVALDSKSVNVALETSFSFDPKENKKDRSFIADLRGFLDKLENLLSGTHSTKHPKHRDTENQLNPHVHLALRASQSKGILTNFLLELANIVLDSEDQYVNTLIKSLELETKRSYLKDPIFHQIVFDPRLKAFIKNSLKEWSSTSPEVIRDELKSFIENEDDNALNNFSEVLNGFYDEQDEKQMNSILNKIRSIPKRAELLEIVRNALNLIIYEPYKKLNGNSKAAVGEEVGKLSDYVGKHFKKKAHDPIFNFRRIRSREKITGIERVLDLADSRQKNIEDFMESAKIKKTIKNKEMQKNYTDFKVNEWKQKDIKDSLELIKKRIMDSKMKKEQQTNIVENDQYQQNLKEALKSVWNRKKHNKPKLKSTEDSIKSELTRNNSKHSLEIEDRQKNIKDSIDNEEIPRNINYFINKSIEIEDKNMKEFIKNEPQQEITKGSIEVNQNIKKGVPRLKNSMGPVEVTQNKKEYDLYQIVRNDSMELNQNIKQYKKLQKNLMDSFELNMNMKNYKPQQAFNNALKEIEINQDMKEIEHGNESKQKKSEEKVSIEKEIPQNSKDSGSVESRRKLNLNIDEPLEIDLDKSLDIHIHDDNNTPRNANGIDSNGLIPKSDNFRLGR